MCTGYTYGTTREVMLAIDNSGSMGLSGAAAVASPVIQAIAKVDPRCPRWGAMGYASQENSGGPVSGPPTWVQDWSPLRPIRRGRANATGVLFDFSWPEGVGENPGFLMLKAGELWDVPADELVTLTQPTGSMDRVGNIPGWGGRELHAGPPRRILLMVGDESSGIGAADSDTNNEIIANLQAAEITVLAVNCWPANPDGLNRASLDTANGMTAICEATGGEIIQDAMDRLFNFGAPKLDENGDPVLDNWGNPILEIQAKPQAEIDAFIDEIADMIRRHKWRDTGYPYIA